MAGLVKIVGALVKVTTVRERRSIGQWLVLLLILILAAGFRFYKLSDYSQVGGDDVAYREKVPEHVAWAWDLLWERGIPLRGVAAPLIAAVRMSHYDVDKTVTSWAKPFFLLELALVDSLVGLNSFKLHLWMAVLGVLSVAAIFFAGKILPAPSAGLIAAFLLAVSPWAVRYSTWGLHVAGGGLWLLLGLLAGSMTHHRPTFASNLVFGVLLSVALLYSTSMLWPVLFLVLFEIIRRGQGIFFIWVKRKDSPWERREQLKLLLGFGLGFLIPFIFWEVLNLVVCLFWVGYTPFPVRLAQALQDNAAHTAALPVDRWFFWRHLKDTEGWPIVGMVSISLLSGVYYVFRKDFEKRIELLRLLFTFLGVTVVMNYSGGAQVARHFYPALLLGFLITGAMAAELIKHRRFAFKVMIPLALAVGAQHFFHLKSYRLSRQAPAIIEAWERQNHLEGQIGTMSMQQWDLLPTLTMLFDWKHLEDFAAAHPRAHIMYSDYIGIAHGAWFYHNREQLMMAETLRRCEEVVLETPSYLSYRPMLYENEFYYWGLLRHPFASFDPRVKVFPAEEVRRARAELMRDTAALARIEERLKLPPPVEIPAWKKRLTLPYMERRECSSHPEVGIISWIILFLWALFSFQRHSALTNCGGCSKNAGTSDRLTLSG